MCSGIYEPGHYRFIYADLKKKFKVPKYSLILQKDYNKAIKHLQVKKAILRSKIKSLNATRFKQYIIPTINQLWHINLTKCNLDAAEYDLLDFCIRYTGKRKTSLENYSADDLDKIYKFLLKN